MVPESTNQTEENAEVLGCSPTLSIVLGVIAIIWGIGVGVLGGITIAGGDPWDAWLGYILTFFLMVGLGVLGIALGLEERRKSLK
ncbi:MAG: hypothetical protein ACUVV0_01655 [Anaerolineae bacterium]